MRADVETLVAEVAARCRAAGLDLIQSLCADWYNRSVEEPLRLPDFGRPHALAILIGNTRALWTPFVAALQARPALLDAEHPLDAYVVESVGKAVASCSMAPCNEVRWAHEGPPRLVAMQRLAHVAGLAYLSPAHLSIHRVYGPWIAWRAVVCVDAEGPAGPSPAPASPCDDCDVRCVAALRAAVATGTRVPEHWRAWVAVRDACPVGVSYRYDEEQIRYHYTRDKGVLCALTAHRAPGTGSVRSGSPQG